MSRDDEKLVVANAPTKYKIRIHAQAFVLKRRLTPRYEAQKTASGLVVQVENWYDEYPMQEIAVNHNDSSVRISTLKEMLGNLSATVAKQLQDFGMIK